MQRRVLAFRADATSAIVNILGLNSPDISTALVAAAGRSGGARRGMFLSVRAFLE
jgi:hypothetical protein